MRSPYLKKILLAIALIGVVLGAVLSYNIYTIIFSPNTSFTNEKAYIYIETGASFKTVKEQLKPLLKNINSFKTVAQKKGYTTAIKAGKYALIKGMNNNDIVNTLRSGNIPLNVSFNNQERIEKLAGRIAEQLETDSITLLKAFTDEQFLREHDFNEDSALSMYIPNTYQFFWNTSGTAFRDRMLKEHHKFWNEDRTKKAKKLNLTKNEVITLASIVQKETAKTSERPRIAGVYLNRLKEGMPLQADPTVHHAIKKHTGNYDTVIKRTLYRDLEIDSPYNTYKYTGLPPGPISMPDIAAIDAVLNAEQHDYYYFVVDVSNFGYHKFARTLAQHNRNKAPYIRWIKKQNIRR